MFVASCGSASSGHKLQTSLRAWWVAGKRYPLLHCVFGVCWSHQLFHGQHHPAEKQQHFNFTPVPNTWLQQSFASLVGGLESSDWMTLMTS